MEQETLRDKYPRITQDQISIWLADPVTKTYFQCLHWMKEDVMDDMGKGGCIDSTNSDHTFAKSNVNLGYQQGLTYAYDYKLLFNRFAMVELPVKEVVND